MEKSSIDAGCEKALNHGRAVGYVAYVVFCGALSCVAIELSDVAHIGVFILFIVSPTLYVYIYIRKLHMLLIVGLALKLKYIQKAKVFEILRA